MSQEPQVAKPVATGHIMHEPTRADRGSRARAEAVRGRDESPRLSEARPPPAVGTRTRTVPSAAGHRHWQAALAAVEGTLRQFKFKLQQPLPEAP